VWGRISRVSDREPTEGSLAVRGLDADTAGIPYRISGPTSGGPVGRGRRLVLVSVDRDVANIWGTPNPRTDCATDRPIPAVSGDSRGFRRADPAGVARITPRWDRRATRTGGLGCSTVDHYRLPTVPPPTVRVWEQYRSLASPRAFFKRKAGVSPSPHHPHRSQKNPVTGDQTFARGRPGRRADGFPDLRTPAKYLLGHRARISRLIASLTPTTTGHD